MWVLCLLIAVITSAGFIVLTFRRGKKFNRNRIPLLITGLVISSIVLMIPVYAYSYSGGIAETCAITVSQIFKMFVADSDITFIMNGIDRSNTWIVNAYRVMFCIVFIMAPVLTLSFILTFCRSLIDSIRMALNPRRPMVVFSALNESSLMLAYDMYNRNPRQLVLFTDVYADNSETISELIQRAEEINAICKKNDITMLNLDRRKTQPVKLMIIGENRAQNMSHALRLIKQLRDRNNMHLVLFSTHKEDEVLLEAAQSSGGNESGIVGRCFNRAQSTIYNDLYSNGYENLFASAKERADGVKVITAVVVGMGVFGNTMLKTLPWLCQIPGYEVHIHSFDVRPTAEGEFKSECPELMADDKNGCFGDDTEAQYHITIHSGVDVMTDSFDKAIAAIPDITYVFVATGDDDRNIMVAKKMRALCFRNGCRPVIQTIIYDSDKSEVIAQWKNHRYQQYDIGVLGDIRTTYSEEMINDSQWMSEALARHMRWGNADDFWRYSDNNKVALAKAIFDEIKKKCGLPALNEETETVEDRLMREAIEHRRWRAYMRTEGYVYSGSKDKNSRNEIAKMHHDLG